MTVEQLLQKCQQEHFSNLLKLQQIRQQIRPIEGYLTTATELDLPVPSIVHEKRNFMQQQLAQAKGECRCTQRVLHDVRFTANLLWEM